MPFFGIPSEFSASLQTFSCSRCFFVSLHIPVSDRAAARSGISGEADYHIRFHFMCMLYTMICFLLDGIQIHQRKPERCIVQCHVDLILNSLYIYNGKGNLRSLCRCKGNRLAILIYGKRTAQCVLAFLTSLIDRHLQIVPVKAHRDLGAVRLNSCIYGIVLILIYDILIY